jgi:O-antigen/teichoic acid export membrane protein
VTARPRVAAATAGQWGARGGGLLLQAGHFALAARGLGTDAFAGWAAALALLSIATAVAEFGLTDTLVLALGRDGADPVKVVATGRRASGVLLGAGVVVTAVGLAFLPGEARIAALSLVPWFLVARRSVVGVAYRRWALDFGRLAAAELAGRTTAVVTVLPLVVAGSAWSTAVQLSVASGSLALGGAVTLVVLRPPAARRGVAVVGTGALLAAALPLGLSTAAAFVHAKADQLVLVVVSGTASVPAYAVGARIFDAIHALAYAGAVVGFSHLVRAAPDDRVAVARRHQAVLVGASLVLGATVFVAAPVLVALLAGDEYRDAVALTRWLAPAMVAAILTFTAAQIAIADGRGRQLLVWAAAGAVANVGAAALLGARYGATGAALATVATETACMFAVARVALLARPGVLGPVATIVPLAAFTVATWGGLALWEQVHPVSGVALALAALAWPAWAVARELGAVRPRPIPLPTARQGLVAAPGGPTP